ncbi:MAG: restriction endonuclease subunit M [Clostridiales bacterium]|nr:restriction endonuclease subunit M [Clostridiales bacterium]
MEDTRDTTAYNDNKTGFHSFDEEILKILLKDRTTGGNIIWATDDYVSYNPAYRFKEEITCNAILSKEGGLVRPRVKKSSDEQIARVRDKAEVFTPSWICNDQNNLVDEAWFGYKNVFNTRSGYKWVRNAEHIVFPNTDGKDWKSYVKENRLEITCGEAPYLVSRYDASSGEDIPVGERIGLLDRKLRVVDENVPIDDKALWYEWAKSAYKSVYGYEWQGDNLLMARENLLFTFVEYYEDRFNAKPTPDMIEEIAKIISWNIWQMDGLKYVIPDSCKMIEETSDEEQMSLFGPVKNVVKECPGCATGDVFKHNGIRCKIKDWYEKDASADDDKGIEFVELLRGEVKLYTASI